MRRVKAEYNQTIWDIAIQYMGSVEAAVDLLVLNNDLNASDTIPKGYVVLLPEIPLKQAVVDYFEQNGIVPATGVDDELLIYTNDDGMITRNLNYDLSGGDVAFTGIRLYNLNKDLTVQINYTGINTGVTAYIESSLDGINYAPIPDAFYTLDKTKDSHQFIIIGLTTAYVRLRIEGAVYGTIDKLIIEV